MINSAYMALACLSIIRSYKILSAFLSINQTIECLHPRQLIIFSSEHNHYRNVNLRKSYALSPTLHSRAGPIYKADLDLPIGTLTVPFDMGIY